MYVGLRPTLSDRLDQTKRPAMFARLSMPTNPAASAAETEESFPLRKKSWIIGAACSRMPMPAVTLQTVGPTLQAFGTEKQKEKFLPGILDGTIHFAIGYSEPDAGTDLAALASRLWDPLLDNLGGGR